MARRTNKEIALAKEREYNREYHSIHRESKYTHENNRYATDAEYRARKVEDARKYALAVASGERKQKIPIITHNGVRYYGVRAVAIANSVSTDKVKELSHLGIIPPNTLGRKQNYYTKYQMTLIRQYLEGVKIGMYAEEQAIIKMHKRWSNYGAK